MSTNRPVAIAPKPPPLSEDTIRLLIQQQTLETELRGKELQVRMQELQNNSTHAEKVLGAQERDLSDERTHVRKLMRDRLYFGGLCVLGLVIFVVIAMFLNKEQLVADLVKIIAGVVAGGLGGYGWARSQKGQLRSDSDN